jgi:hypothetical protein
MFSRPAASQQVHLHFTWLTNLGHSNKAEMSLNWQLSSIQSQQQTKFVKT